MATGINHSQPLFTTYGEFGMKEPVFLPVNVQGYQYRPAVSNCYKRTETEPSVRLPTRVFPGGPVPPGTGAPIRKANFD